MRLAYFSRFINELIPFPIRKRKISHFVFSITSAIRVIHDQFQSLQNETDQILLHNAQVASIEHFINTRLQDMLFTDVVVRTESDRKEVFYSYSKFDATDSFFTYYPSELMEIQYAYRKEDVFGRYDYVIDVQEYDNVWLFERIKSEALKLNISGKRFIVYYDPFNFIYSHE